MVLLNVVHINFIILWKTQHFAKKKKNATCWYCHNLTWLTPMDTNHSAFRGQSWTFTVSQDKKIQYFLHSKFDLWNSLTLSNNRIMDLKWNPKFPFRSRIIHVINSHLVGFCLSYPQQLTMWAIEKCHKRLHNICCANRHLVF